MAYHLAETIVPTEVAALAIAASPDTASTNSVKMDDADGVCFVYPVVLVADTGVITLTVEESDDDSVWNDTDLSIALTAASTDEFAGQDILVDARRPMKDYVRLKVARTVADSSHGSITALRYDFRSESVEDHTSIAGVAKSGSPAAA